MAPFDGMYMTSYFITIVMFVLSFTIYELFANQLKFQKVDLKMRVKVKADKY